MAIAGIVGIVGAACLVGYGWDRSSYSTHQGLYIDQPVPFSHQHHVKALGIDCRYCHTSVEKSGFAGIPPTSTCMNCHQQIWTEAAVLQPVRDSWQQDKPIHWNRVNRLPDFVFFNHSIHVNKGVGCIECHGRIDEMPLTYAASPMTMQWCLDCHKDPTGHLRPKDQVTNMTWQPPTKKEDSDSLQKALMATYKIHPVGLTDCSTCHR